MRRGSGRAWSGGAWSVGAIRCADTPGRSRSTLQRSTLLTLLSALVTFAHASFVYESPNELFATGDFDGDGREDVVIVDRASGSYRVAYQSAPSEFTWASPRASGIPNVTGLAVGRFFNAGRDALALTSPEGNRVNLLDVTDPSSAGLPTSAFLAAIGPNVVARVDIGDTDGAGPDVNTPHDDLFVGSVWNGGAAPNKATRLRNNGASPMPLLPDGTLFGPPARANRVLLKAGSPEVVGLLLRGAGGDAFETYDLSGGAITPALPTLGVPARADYVAARFNASPRSQFLFYGFGSPDLILRPVEEGAGELFFGAATTFNLGDNLGQVIALPGEAATKLLVIFASQERAAVYDFDGVSAPGLVQEFSADAAAGEFFTGAVPLAGNNFLAFYETGQAGHSTQFKLHRFAAGAYTVAAAGVLSSLSPLTARGNVLQFQRPPFVSETPNLLRTLNAQDWSSAFVFGVGNVSVTAERFVNSPQGLDIPAALALGPPHPLADAALVNQYTAFLSLFSFAPALGDEISDVAISPEPGAYKTSIKVLFRAEAGHSVHYRFGLAGPWQLYSAPFDVFTNGTIHYYGQEPGPMARRSAIRAASYSFTTAPATRDSDDDGVPDYVEIANGLDPVDSGSDADEDGYSDLQELIEGTGPDDPADSPTRPDGSDADAEPDPAPQGIEQRSAFDVAVSPLAVDADGERRTLPGAVVRAFDLQGSLLAFDATRDLGLEGVPDPAVRLTNLLVDARQRFVVVATEQHFDIDTPGLDKRVGRELVGLVPVPQLTPATVAYQYGDNGGNLPAEAAGWVAAARGAYPAERPLVMASLDVLETLKALLLERKIAEILRDRGTEWWADLTLFPFRAADAARTNTSQALLASLEADMDKAPPVYRLQAMFTGIAQQLEEDNAPNRALRGVATEIYRTSARLNNAAPAEYPPPLDVLREFLHTGALHANYLPEVEAALGAGAVADARAGAAAVLAALDRRPTALLRLVVERDSFSGNCTTLRDADSGLLKSLFDSGGNPFRFPDAFAVLPGTRVQVCGYTDLTHACGGDGVEVISAGLDTLVVGSDGDGDGDLLVDSWERQFLAGLGSDAFGDDDGDGWQNLQEMFEGSDPNDVRGVPERPAVDLSPPPLQLDPPVGGTVRLRWAWPAAYADRVRFGIRASGDVAASFAEVVNDVPQVGGQYDVTLELPAGPPDAFFFLVTMSLRGR